MGLNEKISQFRVRLSALKRIHTRLAGIDKQLEQQICILRAIKTEGDNLAYDGSRLDSIILSLNNVRYPIQQELTQLDLRIDAITRKL